MDEKLEIKALVKKITGQRISIQDNGKYYTISTAVCDTDNGFGYYKDEILNAFNVRHIGEYIRFDAGSFDIMK